MINYDVEREKLDEKLQADVAFDEAMKPVGRSIVAVVMVIWVMIAIFQSPTFLIWFTILALLPAIAGSALVKAATKLSIRNTEREIREYESEQVRILLSEEFDD